MTRTSATTARRSLKALWKGWRVYSRADGTLWIVPKWRSQVHGVLTRIAAARMLDELIHGQKR